MFVFLNLKESPSFFFILLSFIMFFFCLYFYFSNKKLKAKIVELELENKEILEREILKNVNNNDNDMVSIDKISVKDSKNKDLNKSLGEKDKKINKSSSLTQEVKEAKEETVFNYIKNNSDTLKKNENRYSYNDGLKKENCKKNENRYSYDDGLKKEICKKNDTNVEKLKMSSQSIDKKNLKSSIIFLDEKLINNDNFIIIDEIPIDNSFDSVSKNMGKFENNVGYKSEKISISSILDETFQRGTTILDLDEFVQKNEKRVPKINGDINNIDYLKELSNQLKKIPPQTVELTEYEKNQEEHAIISYKELLALKDEIKILDDEISKY